MKSKEKIVKKFFEKNPEFKKYQNLLFDCGKNGKEKNRVLVRFRGPIINDVLRLIRKIIIRELSIKEINKKFIFLDYIFSENGVDLCGSTCVYATKENDNW